MHRLGFTRSSHQTDHLLVTPDTFVRAARPGMQNATAIVHVSPAVGAQFTEYTAEFAAGGCLGPTECERFVFVLEGEVAVDVVALQAEGYAYLPPGSQARVTARAPARAVVIEKIYDGPTPPPLLTGDARSVESQALMGDEDLQVRVLIPEGPAFDFAVNTMTFQPGAALGMVEMHVMEHGLLMLDGGGIYRLGEKWYPVTAGDFIWMAPYCPQWFGALGKTPARYLIYKDWNR